MQHHCCLSFFAFPNLFLSHKKKKRHHHHHKKSENGSGADEGSINGSGSSSKAALLRKSLSDKGWAEKQTAGFTNWLNFTLVGAEQLRHGSGGGGDDDGEEGVPAEMGGVSSSPLKAMVAMVSGTGGGLRLAHEVGCGAGWKFPWIGGKRGATRLLCLLSLYLSPRVRCDGRC